MKTLFYKATVYKFTDLEESLMNHTSISGGKASHNFEFIEEFKDEDLNALDAKIRSLYGKEYDKMDNSIYIGIPENEWNEKECPEHYEVIFEKVQIEDVER